MSRLTRRQFLSRSAAIGCSLAASPLVTPVTLASAPGDARLVVIILRGAMDGLDVLPPLGDPEFAALRPDHAATPLDGFYGLHPALDPLRPLWDKGALAFAHAVSTPYRDARSHFDGQDLLEAGTAMDALGRLRDGWLNRLLAQMPGAVARTAYSVGLGDMLLMRGDAPVANWSPDAALLLSPQAERLLEGVLHDDPLFREAAAEAIDLSRDDAMAATATAADMMSASAAPAARSDAIAEFAAARLREDARIAAFSLTGFDTHANQHRTLPRALTRLASAITALETGLGPAVWQRTAVVAITEFGRTARLNGSGGTDHGTAGAMIMAGGALRGGRVEADWPGLSEAALYQRRDLRPTRDLRAHLAWIIRGLYGSDIAALERDLFPGLDMGTDPRLIV
ncbi:DUF1501 domain-containing protein [Roseovarius sp. S4756]|uniref:DUF1501 domain-containing protein n=1 Tax=Roseovarius maritimus TaxID=3342637 RepID=UPI00372B420B